MATIKEKKGKNGAISYYIEVSTGYDTSGKQIRKYMTWKPKANMTKAQIKAQLKTEVFKFEEKCKSGQILDNTIRFSTFAERWFSEYAEKQLRPTTLNRYKSMMPRINKAIGHMPLEKLQPHHLIQFYNNLSEDGIRDDVKYLPLMDLNSELEKMGVSKARFSREKNININAINAACKQHNIDEGSAKSIASGLERNFYDLFIPSPTSKSKLSNKTIIHHHRLISSILSTAVQWQVIPQNICSRVKPPKAEKKEIQFLDEIGAKALLTALESETINYKSIIILLLFSGLRRGEALGLEWKDIDFSNNTLSVTKSNLYLKDHGVFEDNTKNRSSNRVIKISPLALDTLRQLKLWQAENKLMLGDKWCNSNKVFTTIDGKPMHPDTATSWFRKFLAKNHLPHVPLHSLRHTHATLLIASGTDIRTVSNRLGHSQTSVTLDTYSHAIKSADAIAIENLDKILS